ncbi:MAG: hypothetical protein M5U19_21415 [Microthrixaceae bacterium]|nr:hypothetical protein [Microthrixaceae bacterium]
MAGAHRAPRWWPVGSPTASADGISAPGAAVLVGAPAVADLQGDGSLEVVVADSNGTVHVWGADGATQATMSVDPDFSRQEHTDERNRTKSGFYGSAALGDLDGDGTLGGGRRRGGPAPVCPGTLTDHP